MDGFLEAVAAAEGFQQLDRGTHRVKRRESQDARVVEAGDSLVLVLLQQRFEDGPRLPSLSE